MRRGGRWGSEKGWEMGEWGGVGDGGVRRG